MSRLNGTRVEAFSGLAENLLRTMADPSPNVATVAVEVDVSADQLSRARDALAHIATTERQLRQAGEAREEHARQLGVAVTELHQVLNGPTQPTEVEEKAGRLARAWFLGRWRRTRFLCMHGLGAYDGDRVAECLALACFAAAEADWRDLHSHVASIDDRELSKALHGAEAAVRAASRTLLASTVQTHARAGRRRILDLLRARDSDRSDWPDIREVLGRAHGHCRPDLRHGATRFAANSERLVAVPVTEAARPTRGPGASAASRTRCSTGARTGWRFRLDR